MPLISPRSQQCTDKLHYAMCRCRQNAVRLAGSTLNLSTKTRMIPSISVSFSVLVNRFLLATVGLTRVLRSSLISISFALCVSILLLSIGAIFLFLRTFHNDHCIDLTARHLKLKAIDLRLSVYMCQASASRDVVSNPPIVETAQNGHRRSPNGQFVGQGELSQEALGRIIRQKKYKDRNKLKAIERFRKLLETVFLLGSQHDFIPAAAGEGPFVILVNPFCWEGSLSLVMNDLQERESITIDKMVSRFYAKKNCLQNS